MQTMLPSAAQGLPRSGPSFKILEDRPIRSSAYLYGTLLSLAMLAGVGWMAKHAGHFPSVHRGDDGSITVDPWATGAAGDSGGASVLAIANGDGSSHAAQPGTVRPISRVVHVGAPPAEMPFFDAAEKHRVLTGVAAVLKQHYPDQAAAQRLGRSLLSAEGTLMETSDPAVFADGITRALRGQSGDVHFEVAYTRGEAPGRAAPAVNEAAYRRMMQEANCMMAAPTILPHNIGYLKLDWFAEPEACGDRVIAALKALSRADGLIIDLRENSGGSPEMVMLIAGWLFEKPAFFWNPREGSAARMWTPSPMAGSGLAHKPLWVLTSSRTYSAAEQFAYNLKMLHRATLVGETTAGATDVGIFHRIDDHFGIAFRESRIANPYGTPDWAVKGVEPDVHVPAGEALDAARKLAAH